MAAPSSAARAVTYWSSTRWGTAADSRSTDNTAVVLSSDGAEVSIPDVSKDLLAHRLWDLVAGRV